MMWRAALLVLWLLGSTLTCAAETQDVLIVQAIDGADVSAPSVPSGLSATSLSLFSIELNWNASIDNFGVAGYRVWRDGLAIATTTMTSYTDSGLATSTSYAYYVTAFDAAGNESASSTSVIGTTLAPAPPSVATPAAGCGRQLARGMDVQNVSTVVTEQSVTVTFTTDRFVQSRVRWSTLGGAENIVQGTAAVRAHEFVLDGLEPGTRYELLIETYTDERFLGDAERLVVTTTALPDQTPPSNVRNLQAEAVGGGVELRWENPPELDFARVRVVRSTRWFPLDTVDGWVVYEGAGVSFTDQVRDRPIFYTVFSIDESGNISSGAVVALYEPATMTLPADGVTPPPPVLPEIIPPTFQATTSAPVRWPVYVAQGDRVTMLATSSAVSVSANLPFIVRIPANAVPSHLKTIVVELRHPDPVQGSFSFLLRRTTTGDDYEAQIGALPSAGTYEIDIRWLDFATHETGMVQGVLQLSATPGLQLGAASSFIRWWLLALVIGFVVVVRIILRRNG
jgi:hypothetical protein